MAKLYRLTYYEKGQRENRISPFVNSAGQALGWLLQLKPYLIRQVFEIEIKEHRRTDSPR